MRERAIAAISAARGRRVLAGCTGTSGVNTQDLTTAPASSTISGSISSTADPSSSARALSPASTPSTADTAASVSAGTEGLSPQETADRAAIEAQWDKLWQVYLALPHTPEGDRQALAAAVAVDPALTNLLTDANTLNRRVWDSYGQFTLGSRGHKPSTASDGGHRRLPGRQPSRISRNQHRKQDDGRR